MRPWSRGLTCSRGRTFSPTATCHLPAAAAYCRALGLVELVDHMVPTGMALRPGLAVQAMVLDTLSGRTPLYRVEQFLADQEVELLLGEAVPAHVVTDTNLARSLDAIFAAGTAKMVTALGVRAVATFGLDASAISYDTTSTNVWGAYRACACDAGENAPPGPVITFGHSKDHRPDLKQCMTERLCVERGVPIFGRTLEGNASDKTANNQRLSRISTLMAQHGLGPGAFVYVADSAMVTEKNLSAVGTNQFLSRLPATYNDCARVIAEAVTTDAWVPLGPLAEHAADPHRPCAEYKACAHAVTLYGTTYRAVVVHASAHDTRRQKKLAKALVDSAASLTAALRKVPDVYACEADAMSAAARAETLSDRVHTVTATVRPVAVRRRRPPRHRPAPTTTRYALSTELAVNTAGVEQERRVAGCFVLLTNVPCHGAGGLDAARLLQTYKGQYGVENDFAFLKDPLVVNDLFLKTPSRIDALGLILIIALLIVRLMERRMRAPVAKTNTTMPGWDRQQTTKPTTFMMIIAMTGIMVARVGGRRWLLRGPGPTPLAFLHALGLGPTAFTDPHCRCVPIIPVKRVAKG
ncbi:MAG: transposase [Gemmatimonas sp.]|nr:transposase [Gemmatimonas sp.]